MQVLEVRTAAALGISLPWKNNKAIRRCLILIKNIYQLGSYYLNEHPSILEGLTVPVNLTKDIEQYLLIINLNTTEKVLEIVPYQMSSNTYLTYRYIGSADGAASPQWYGTVRNVAYLLSQTIPNLIERWNREDPFYKDLKEAKAIFFEDLGVKKASDKRYQFIFNPKFFGAERTVENNKNALKEVVKLFENYLKKDLQVNPKDVLLYSLSINDQLIVFLPEYERLVLQEKFSVFSEQKGICAITNKKDYVTGETTKLKFSYYINDKISFASHLEKKNYVKNLAIGKEAYKKILVGESFIIRNFSTRFNSLPCLIIPAFLFDFSGQEDIPFDDFSTHIMNMVFTVQTLKEFEKLERDVKDYIEHSGLENHITLDFLFYTKIQAAMKVNKFLRNVPLNHLQDLKNKMFEMRNFGTKYFGNGNWNMGLNSLYFLIPMKEQKNESVEKRKILLLYESLLSNKVLSYDWLIQQFLILGKIHMYKQYETYQIGESKEFSNDMQLVSDMLRSQLLLKMLMDLHLVRKGGNGTVEYQLKDESMINYMQEMAFNESQSSLFLLGVLIAKVGAAQAKKQREAEKESSGSGKTGTSNKPVLNKINFQGMNRTRLQMLSVDVFEKLRQTRQLSPANELIFAEHKRLFDKANVNWRLSDRECVYYLLSGYAFGTKMILSGKSSKSKSEEEQNDE